MSENCIFCKIINKEIPSVIVYEDDLFISILDKFPSAPYHILVIPKNHEENIFDISAETKQGILTVVNKVALSLKQNGFENINIIQNNGVLAGQSVNHFHIHLIPRLENDTFNISFTSKEEDDVTLQQMKEKLVKYIH